MGPKLLGTFLNGRFEQFLHAKPLSKSDLRDPDCSVQIAKRMRELHDGIALTPNERSNGPSVWSSYDKWMVRASEVLVEMEKLRSGSVQELLQAPLEKFKNMIEIYRKWLANKYGHRVHDDLVFAHNDVSKKHQEVD
jgi:choline kinase